MKVRLGLCAFFITLAGCSNQGPDAGAGKAQTAAPTAIAGGAPMFTARDPSASIASAPDRGALIDYSKDSGSLRQQGAYTLHRVALSEDHALRALVTGQMNVPTPDGGQVRLKYERHVEDADGNWTWIGRLLDGDQMQEAIITFGEKAVYGSIPQGNGLPPLRIHTNQGSLWAVATDASQVPDILSGTVDVLVPPVAAAGTAQAQGATAQSALSSVAAAVSPATVLDLAVGYTSGFSTSLGGDSQATTRLSFLLQVANQSFSNSGITGGLRVVRAVKVDYVDNTTNKSALEQLTGNSGSGAVTVPASLVPLREARDEYGADLVVLVRDFQSPENDGCGIAWLNGANQTNITAADAPYGYAVVSDGFDEGTDGKTYFCADETMIHELAHVMGSAHDRENSTSSSGGTLFGRYPYSFGLKTTTGGGGNFYTIMAYGESGQNFYRTFSNPAVVRCGPGNGLACGIPDEADNARSLNQTIPVIATFRSTVVPLAGLARNDIDGDGKSDLLWNHQSNGNLASWIMNGAAVERDGLQEGGIGFQPIATGDFNGDGFVDIIWNRAQGDMQMWLGNGSVFAGQFFREYPTGWNLVGTGDVDGDGRDDLIWHQPSSGRLAYWQLNGITVISEEVQFAGGGFVPIALGDFNGDGQVDIVWNRPQGDMQMWLGTGTGFAGQAFRDYPAGWNLVAAGDVDGDGKDDLLWHQPAAGILATWILDAATVSSDRSQFAGGGFAPIATGDFNGDGRTDIVWNRPEGDMQLWTADATAAYSGQFLRSYPGEWNLVQGLGK